MGRPDATGGSGLLPCWLSQHARALRARACGLATGPTADTTSSTFQCAPSQHPQTTPNDRPTDSQCLRNAFSPWWRRYSDFLVAASKLPHFRRAQLRAQTNPGPLVFDSACGRVSSSTPGGRRRHARKPQERPHGNVLRFWANFARHARATRRRAHPQNAPHARRVRSATVWGRWGAPRARARFCADFSPEPLLKHDFGSSSAATRARGAPTTTPELFLLHKPRAHQTAVERGRLRQRAGARGE